ncbi:MAG: methylated-DNA--[protein]-cysteine S-methyltransferase [Coriobacteriia bacterium]|nr:methylated-DNA--[protein]-cysteine S-methyltransferase [Coriobacteriia bacterium]
MTSEDASYFTYNTPVGKVTIECDGTAIVRLVPGEATLEGRHAPTVVANKAATQLQEYFAGKRRIFDVPIAPRGSVFQNDVLRAVEHIPYGETRTYSEIAATIDRPGAARAVGSALSANPIPIIIPCHRVVPSGGGLGGYAYGPEMKRYLLNLEGASL